MQGVDIVVHTAAALPPYLPEEILWTDIEGTRNLLETAEKHFIKRFVHISYMASDHHPLY